MQRTQFTNIDEYIASFPPATQKVLKELRSIMRKSIPGVEETISYGIPCYKKNGRYVIYFAGFKNHTSVYPAPRGNEAFTELSEYEGGKGTVQFPLDKPLPVRLITKIVKFRLKENEEKTVLKKIRKKTTT